MLFAINNGIICAESKDKFVFQLFYSFILGKTLKDVFETQGFGELVYNPEKSEEKRCLSLILLHGLLENFELLQQGKFTHGDGHGKLCCLLTLPLITTLLCSQGHCKKY